MSKCQKCGGVNFMQAAADIIICVQCGAQYRINNNINDGIINMTKCEKCGLFFMKETENVCDCRKIENE